jgi:hypothetical protein
MVSKRFKADQKVTMEIIITILSFIITELHWTIIGGSIIIIIVIVIVEFSVTMGSVINIIAATNTISI